MWGLPFHVLAVVAWPALASAAGTGPEGRWETIDDRTGARKPTEGRPRCATASDGISRSWAT